MEILISISKNDYNYNKANLCHFLSNYFSVNNCLCEICSYNEDKTIKEGLQYSSRNACIKTNIIFPKFLFFIFDLIEQNEDDISQYHNLLNDKDK